MPSYVLHRNYTLVTLSGRAIEFVKGKPTHVPPDCVKAAVGIGAVPADGSDPNLVLDGDEVLVRAPTDPEERLEKILEVVRNLVIRNERDDFTAAGIPSPKVVTRILGWKVDLREVHAAYRAYSEQVNEVRAQEEIDKRVEAS